LANLPDSFLGHVGHGTKEYDHVGLRAHLGVARE
jgi:hypothetical protein